MFWWESVLYLSRIFFIKYKFWNEDISGCRGYVACVIPFAFHGFIIFSLKKPVVDKCSWLQPLGFVQLGRSISNTFCFLLLWGHGTVVKEEVTGSSRGNSLLQKLQENATYKDPQVVWPFSGPVQSGSFIHRDCPLLSGHVC
jgi:hypothetical protein